MPIFNTCPKCGKYGRLTQDDFVGWPVRCPVCQTKFIAKTTTGDFPIAEPFLPPVGPDGPAAEGEPTFQRVGGDIPKSIGRFQIRFWLGRGGFGDVYRAYDPVLEREVALKVPRAKTLNSPERVARFLREAKSAAGLRHPHIVPVFDSGQDGDRYYIATAFIDGLSLDKALELRPLGFVQIAKLVRALAEALAYAHSQGIVHRDIKPANIMLDLKGEPYLVDFGLAGRLDGPVETDHPSDDDGDLANADSKMTQRADAVTTNKRVRMGTPGYWSSEQAAGLLKNVKAPTDQYSLGMVLYEMLCGQTAFSGPPILLQAHAQKTPPPPPRSIKPLIPEDLEAICLKTLAKKPEERYPSCQEFADDLRRWLEGEETQVRPLPARERVARWCKKEPLRAWAMAFAGVAVLVVIILSIQFGVREKESARRIQDALDQSKKNEAKAEANAQRADENASIAKKGEIKTIRGLAEVMLDRAQMYGEQKELGLGLPWLARSLEKAEEAGAHDLSAVIRRNMSAWTRSMHALRVSGRFPKQVHALVYHPDGKRFFYGADGEVLEGSMSQYHWSEGKRVPFSLDGIAADQTSVRALAITADGKELLIARGSRIYRGDLESPLKPKFAKVAYIHDEQIVALAVPPAKEADWAAFIDAKGTTWLWNMSNDKSEKLLVDGGPNVLSLAFSPCGQAILLGCTDGTARLLSVKTKKEDWRIARKDVWQLREEIKAVAFHGDGRQVLIARNTPLTGVAELWSVNDRKRPLALFAHQAEIYAVAFSPCSRILVTAGRDRSARLWHADSYQSLGRTLWHPAEVMQVAFHPTKQGLLTIDPEQTVRLWEVRPEKVQAVFTAAPSVNAEDRVRGFATKAQVAYETPLPVGALDSHATGEVYIILLGDKFFRVKDTVGGEIGAPIDPRGIVTAFAIHKGTSRLLTDTMLIRAPIGAAPPRKEFVVQMWNLANGQEVWKFHDVDRQEQLWRVAFNPDGQFAAGVGSDGNFFLWRTAQSKPLLRERFEERLFGLAFSSKSKKLAISSKKIARVYDLEDLKQTPLQLEHPDAVLSAAFSPIDPDLLLTGFVGGAILWNLQKPDERQPLQHLTGVFAVGFSPDGETLVTAGQDKHARLWDRKTRKLIGPPLAHPEPVYAAALTGETLVTATFPPRTTVHHWPLTDTTGEDIAALTLKAKLISNINLDEHNTNQVYDGASWLKLNEKVKNPEKWQETWDDWPAERPKMTPYSPPPSD